MRTKRNNYDVAVLCRTVRKFESGKELRDLGTSSEPQGRDSRIEHCANLKVPRLSCPGNSGFESCDTSAQAWTTTSARHWDPSHRTRSIVEHLWHPRESQRMGLRGRSFLSWEADPPLQEEGTFREEGASRAPFQTPMLQEGIPQFSLSTIFTTILDLML